MYGCDFLFLLFVGCQKGLMKTSIFLFYVGERKEKRWKNMEKEKKKRTVVFFGWWWTKHFFYKNSNSRKKANTTCVRKVEKYVFSLTQSVFGKWYLFGGPCKSPNTTKRGVSADKGEDPKWHFWLQKCHFGNGPQRGFRYLWYTNAALCWKHYRIE